MRLKKGKLLFQFKSVHSTILFSFSVLLIGAILFALILSLKFTQDMVVKNSKEYTMQLIEQVSTEIDFYINYMENISQMVTYNSDIEEYLEDAGNQDIKSQRAYERIISQFSTIMNVRKDIYNIAFLGENGKSIINKGDTLLNPNVTLAEQEWYQNMILADGKSIVSPQHVQNLFVDDYRWVVTLSRLVRNQETKTTEGVFMVDLNYSEISNLCKNISLGKKGYIFIVDDQGNVIYHPQISLLYTGLKEEKIQEVLSCETSSFMTKEDKDSKLYTIFRSEKTGWNVVGVAYREELLNNKTELQIIYMLGAIVLLAIAFGISVWLSQAITKPIKKLEISMKEVEKGHFIGADLQEYPDNEIGMLSKSFNRMTGEIKNLMEENIKEQTLKRKSELKALQAQINPHFLYNTLDSIIWMAEGGKSQEVVLMTSSLAKLFRQSISNENEMVTIGEEIGYVKSYLTIQKMRYQDKLNFDIFVEPSLLDKKIIKLILQPLVENSIYHGIKYKDTKGNINILGNLVDDRIILQVIDDGIGMDDETLSHIFENHEPSGSSNGVGVVNVYERIKAYYGKDYGLYYESKPHIGTVAKIIIPCETGNGGIL